jgi:hypothetical protein
MQNSVPFSQILDFLTELVDNKTSGTLFIHSETNRAITVALDCGQIHALYFGARRGRRAIPLISDISGGSYRFEETNLVDTFHDLPPTPEILSELRASINVYESPLTVSSTTTSSNEAIDDDKKRNLCYELKSLLLQHIGPIADIVFDDAVDEVGDFCTTPLLTKDLINKLSEEIDNTAEIEQFRSRAYIVINNILNS